jgi:hypothetical protein
MMLQARLLIESLIGLALCLTAASGQGLDEVGAVAMGGLDTSAGCPTRFDFEVLASAADSGKLLDLSAYRFRRKTARHELPCQGGDVAGMKASAAVRRSSHIT